MRVLFATAVLVAGLSGVAAGQTCEPAKDSHEADLFAHFSVPLAFSVAQGPRVARPGTVTISLEGTYLPDVSDETATPTTCRPGKGPENVNLVPGFVRPRLAFALANGTYLEISWVPPITINDVKPNLWGFALGRTVPIGKSTLPADSHATIGSIYAPFVCSSLTWTTPPTDCFGRAGLERPLPATSSVQSWPGLELGRREIPSLYRWRLQHPASPLPGGPHRQHRLQRPPEGRSKFESFRLHGWSYLESLAGVQRERGGLHRAPRRRHRPAGAGVFDREVVALGGRRERENGRTGEWGNGRSA